MTLPHCALSPPPPNSHFSAFEAVGAYLLDSCIHTVPCMATYNGRICFSSPVSMPHPLCFLFRAAKTPHTRQLLPSHTCTCIMAIPVPWPEELFGVHVTYFSSSLTKRSSYRTELHLRGRPYRSICVPCNTVGHQ